LNEKNCGVHSRRLYTEFWKLLQTIDIDKDLLFD
jgi:hypothetical protein